MNLHKTIHHGVVIFLVAGLLLSACQPADFTSGDQSGTSPSGSPTIRPPVKLTVFAAASLTESFRAIAQAYTAVHPEVTISFNFAGSQQLVQQLAQGAEADIFASAGQKQMDDAVSSGRVRQGDVANFATNQLVVIAPKDNPVRVNAVQDLARPGLKLILAAQNVPAGQYAMAFIKLSSQDPAFGTTFETSVLNNVVSYEDNVKNVVSKVQLGEADAGVVYMTDAIAAKNSVTTITIPTKLNVIANYPLSVIQDSQHRSAAEDLKNYILSADGQAILAQYGFGRGLASTE